MGALFVAFLLAMFPMLLGWRWMLALLPALRVGALALKAALLACRRAVTGHELRAFSDRTGQVWIRAHDLRRALDLDRSDGWMARAYPAGFRRANPRLPAYYIQPEVVRRHWSGSHRITVNRFLNWMERELVPFQQKCGAGEPMAHPPERAAKARSSSGRRPPVRWRAMLQGIPRYALEHDRRYTILELAAMAPGLDPQPGVAPMPGGKQLRLAGELGYGSTLRVERMLARHPDIEGLELDSPGGRAAEGFALGRLARDLGLDTFVHAGCASACVLVFAGGRERFVGEPARFGLHRSGVAWRAAEDGLSETDREMRRFLLGQGVAPGFVEKGLQPCSSRCGSRASRRCWRAGWGRAHGILPCARCATDLAGE